MTAKGTETRLQILDRATALARVLGVNGVTIGRLAQETGLSKSGLFAHFGSKEALGVAILDHSSRDFVERVLEPALAEPRGERRLRSAFHGWLRWGLQGEEQGGCVFAAAASELDDCDGVVRDRLVSILRDWFDSLAQMVRSGQRDGAFRADADPDQVASELNGLLLGAHQAHRLLHDPLAEERAHRGFERLLVDLRPPEPVRRR